MSLLTRKMIFWHVPQRFVNKIYKDAVFNDPPAPSIRLTIEQDTQKFDKIYKNKTRVVRKSTKISQTPSSRLYFRARNSERANGEKIDAENAFGTKSVVQLTKWGKNSSRERANWFLLRFTTMELLPFFFLLCFHSIMLMEHNNSFSVYFFSLELTDLQFFSDTKLYLPQFMCAYDFFPRLLETHERTLRKAALWKPSLVFVLHYVA